MKPYFPRAPRGFFVQQWADPDGEFHVYRRDSGSCIGEYATKAEAIEAARQVRKSERAVDAARIAPTQYKVGEFLREDAPFAPVFRVIGVLPRSIRIVLSDPGGTLCLSGPTKIGKSAARKRYRTLSREDLDALQVVPA